MLWCIIIIYEYKLYYKFPVCNRHLEDILRGLIKHFLPTIYSKKFFLIKKGGYFKLKIFKVTNINPI